MVGGCEGFGVWWFGVSRVQGKFRVKGVGFMGFGYICIYIYRYNGVYRA